MIQETSIYVIDEQRQEFRSLISAGNAPARVQSRARILLPADRNSGSLRTDAEIAEAALCAKNAVFNIRHRFAEGGLRRALYDKPVPGPAPKFTAEVNAAITMIACSAPPPGRKRWTLRLLADKAVELGYVESISPVSVGNRLKQTLLNPAR